jgi:superfamily II DNA or RNA helicase
VGEGCKHTAAVLFAVKAEQAAARRQGQVSKAQPHKPLPPEFATWLGSMRPLMRDARDLNASAGRTVLYVLRAQTLSGAQRMSAKRPAASLGQPGAALRLHVEAQDVPLSRDGEALGNGQKLSQYHYYYGARPEGPALTPEDFVILRRIDGNVGDTDSDGCLLGLGGYDLLDRILQTGRARWGSARGPRLWRTDAKKLQLGWVHDDLGHTSLVATALEPETFLILLAPPVLIEGETGAVARAETGAEPMVAAQLLRLPSVPPEAADALAASWAEAAPKSIPPPTKPNIRELGRLKPTPVLELLQDQVAAHEWVSDSWRPKRRSVRIPTTVARLTFDYGLGVIGFSTKETTILAREPGGLVRFSRDLDAEARAIERLELTDFFGLDELADVELKPEQEWDFAPIFPAEPEDFARFLLHYADGLRNDGWRVEIHSKVPLKVVDIDQSSFSAELTPSGVDWFDLNLGAQVDGQRVDLIPALTRILESLEEDDLDEFLTSEILPGETAPLLLGDGRIASIPRERVIEMLRALLLLAVHDAQAGPKTPPRLSRRDLGLLADLETVASGLPWSGQEPLRRLASALRDLSFAPTPLPANFTASLRPYQQTGLDWLDALASAGFGGLLADDMGLGKTVQTLAHIAVLKARGDLHGPVLLLAPTSVLPNWQAEAARFTPDLSLLLLHGPDRKERRAAIAGHDLVLTSYPLLVRDLSELAETRFGLVVFDEAHNLKNPRTASFMAARDLKADRKIALTGTPVENRLTDAWALFELVTPGLLGAQRDFVRAYRSLGAGEGASDPQARARLNRTLKPFLLRRTKEAVAKDLPPKSVAQVSINLGAAQMALHESQRLLMHERVREEIARVGLMRAQIMVLTALMRLRQICCDPRLLGGERGKDAPSAKLERLLEMLEEMIAEGRRIVLFSQFTSMLDLIKPELDRLGVAWTELTGRTKDRQTPVAEFQSGRASMILVSLKAGGTGLNLTAADTVVLYDPWWNPAIEAQAIDRAHRIGQTKPVFVYRLVATGTIEEKILQLQERKTAIAEALWSDEPGTTAQLSEDDIAFLLG